MFRQQCTTIFFVTTVVYIPLLSVSDGFRFDHIAAFPLFMTYAEECPASQIQAIFKVVQRGPTSCGKGTKPIDSKQGLQITE